MHERALPTIDLDQIADAGARRASQGLLNRVEGLAADNRALRAEVQRLRDENNRLKGEQGKPAITANTTPPDHSSEQERHQPRLRQVSRKLEQLAIDRVAVLAVDPAVLPPDAEFKGHEPVVVQDVICRTDNILFHKEKRYSPAEGKTYLAPLPPGYTGQFGPGLKALRLGFYYVGQRSEPKILEVRCGVGVKLSDGHLSDLLIKAQAPCHAAKAAVVEAGLRSRPWQPTDDTATRVNGQNQHCHILCNPLYTADTTLPGNDRLSVLDVLRNGRPRTYLLNAEAEGDVERIPVSGVTRRRLRHLPRARVLDEPTLVGLLDAHLPGLGDQARKWVLDALAVAAYQAQDEGPVVRVLVCDDAPQFPWLTEDLALYWVHEGRHHKQLDPFLPPHRQALDDFRTDFWAYSEAVLAYRQAPTPGERACLAAACDRLFG